MKNFKALSIIGLTIVGIPVILLLTALITYLIHPHGASKYIDNNANTPRIDTIYIDKVVEVIKYDTIYIKQPTKQVKPEVGKDTLK